jgi:hypothetical protein
MFLIYKNSTDNNEYKLPQNGSNSVDIILSNNNTTNAYDLPSGPNIFGVRTIRFKSETPITGSKLLVNLASSAKKLINSLFSYPRIGETYEIIIVNETDKNIELMVGGSQTNVINATSVKRLSIVVKNLTPDLEDVNLSSVVISGLGSISVAHLELSVSAPPSSIIPTYYMINNANTLYPLQVTFNTSATAIDSNGPLPPIKDMLGNIANIIPGQKEVVQFISHNKGGDLTWASYKDKGGGNVNLSTQFPGAPFVQVNDTSYLVTLVITPQGSSPNWDNSSMIISCLPLAV